MDKAQRLDLRFKLADRLAGGGLRTEDMFEILDEYLGIDSHESWYDWPGNEHRAWILHVLKSRSEAELLDLHEHFFRESTIEQRDPSSLPWKAGTFRLFISHTHKNAGLAGGVAEVLSRWDMSAFVAHRDIKPTKQWQREIESALHTCDAMAALLSTDFAKSLWCDQEIGWALARSVPVVPVKNTNANPHGFMNKFQAATPERPDAPWVADTIFRALYESSAQERLAVGVARRYALTTNADGIDPNYALLTSLPPSVWTREMVEIVERGQEENAILVAGNSPAGRALTVEIAALLASLKEGLGLGSPTAASDVPITANADDDIPF
jgi:hypothetical protein